jgi:hypothetical protein
MIGSSSSGSAPGGLALTTFYEGFELLFKSETEFKLRFLGRGRRKGKMW